MSFRYTGPGVERRTFESLSKPIMYLDAKQNELEDKIGLLEGEAAKYKKIALEEPNSKAAKFYNEFMNSVSTTSDSLAQEGIFSNNIRNNVIKLNTIYNSDILPIGQAYDQKMKMLEQQRTASLNNPNLRFSKDANSMSIDDFMNNTANYKVLDLNQATQEGLQMGKILSAVNRGDSFEKVLGGQNYIWKKTLGYDMDELLKAGSSPEKIISDYFNKTKGVYDSELLGKYEGDINQAFMKGVLLGTGKSTQTQLVGNKDYDYMLDIQKQNHASKLRKNEIDYQYGILNPKPPKDTPLPKAPGVVPISGERAIKKASDLKGDINAFNNVKVWSANPNAKYKTENKTLIEAEKNKIAREFKIAYWKQYHKNLPLPKDIDKINTYGALNASLPENSELYKIQTKYNDVSNGKLYKTGNELINNYIKSYKVNNENELKDKLAFRANTGTHIALTGDELNSEYVKGAGKIIYRSLLNSPKQFELKEVSTGKSKNVKDLFDEGTLKDGVQIGFSPENKLGYFVTYEGKTYKLSEEHLGLTPTDSGIYRSDAAIKAYEQMMTNPTKYSTEEKQQISLNLENANTSVINTLATRVGVEVQSPKEHTK